MTSPATIIGVDPGDKRIGLAIADLETRFARPLRVIDAGPEAAATIAAAADENRAERIVVGKPVGLSGREGPAVAKQQELVHALRGATTVEIAEFDERLTTVIAEAGLRAAGTRSSDRKELRDAVAAQVMLQGYLDSTS